MNLRGKAFFWSILGLSAVFGCGARTDTLFDDGAGGSGDFTSAAGSSAVGGGGGVVGYAGTGPVGFAGTAPIEVAGYYNGGTGNSIGGSFGVAGAPPAGGAFSTGGVIGVGGVFSTGGVFTGGTGTIGGAPSGGFGAVGAVGGSGGIVDLCVNNAPTACERCLCNSCSGQLDACFADVGCALIFACAQETGCTGLNCYQAATCKPVIDEFGGLTGGSVREVFSLASCSATSGASCGCN
jgi:hypothetical protein